MLLPAPPASSMAAPAPAHPAQAPLWGPALPRRRRRCCAPPPRASLLGGLYDTMVAANAEALARKEGRELVGATRGIQPLTAVPLSLLGRPGKAESCATVLERQGCLGVEGVLSAPTAAELLAFVTEENARCQADVEAGRVEFDARFGGVNCRWVCSGDGWQWVGSGELKGTNGHGACMTYGPAVLAGHVIGWDATSQALSHLLPTPQRHTRKHTAALPSPAPPPTLLTLPQTQRHPRPVWAAPGPVPAALSRARAPCGAGAPI